MSLRHAARAMMDRAAVLTGVLASRERSMRQGLTMLMYHRVLPDERCRGYRLPSLAMPLSAFREQVRYLSSHCRVVVARDGVEHMSTTLGQGRAPVSLTFDDGYSDNFALAAPVLEEFGVRGTFYVCTGLIGTGQRLWFDEAALHWSTHGPKAIRAAVKQSTGRDIPATSGQPSIGDWMAFLKSLPAGERRSVIAGLPAHGVEGPDEMDRLMTPQEIQGLDRRGHEVGSHSVTHPILPRLSDPELERELTQSRAHLASWLGAPPAGFCYPNGDHDARVAAATRRAGYGYACTTAPGRNSPGHDRFRIVRIDMNPRRVTREGVHDETALRAEISLLHGVLR